TGMSRHREPVRSSHRMPSRHSRSSAQGRPPLQWVACSGSNGAMRAHCSSVNTRSVCRDMVGLLSPIMPAETVPKSAQLKSCQMRYETVSIEIVKREEALGSLCRELADFIAETDA